MTQFHANDKPLPDLSADDQAFIEANLALTGIKFETVVSDKELYYKEMQLATNEYQAAEEFGWSQLEGGKIDGIEYARRMALAQSKVDEASEAFYLRHPEYVRD
jgi:hypothetical protein